MKIAVATTVVASLAWANPAGATECTQLYTLDRLVEDLLATEDALRAGDDARAGALVSMLQAGLVCIEDMLPRRIVGSTFRAIGAGLIAGGDSMAGQSWLRTAHEVEPTFEYGVVDLPADHPARRLYSDIALESSGAPVPLEGKTFVGEVFLDGRALAIPEARADRPHLLQLVGDPVRSWLIEGNAFPEEVLESSAPVVAGGSKRSREPRVKEPRIKEPRVKEPRVKEPRVARTRGRSTSAVGIEDEVFEPSRLRPWEKTPLLVGGVALTTLSGGIYLMSSAKRREFDAANSLSQITELQPQVNRLVLASAAVFAVGSGSFTWGVVVGSQGPTLPTVHIRF